MEIGQHEVDTGNLLGGELDHGRAAVDADDMGMGPALGEQFGERPGPRPQVDDGGRGLRVDSPSSSTNARPRSSAKLR